jgi:hypothetical protein
MARLVGVSGLLIIRLIIQMIRQDPSRSDVIDRRCRRRSAQPVQLPTSVGAAVDLGQQPLEDPIAAPAVTAAGHRLPGAIAGRQVPPGRTGAGQPHHCLHDRRWSLLGRPVAGRCGGSSGSRAAQCASVSSGRFGAPTARSPRRQRDCCQPVAQRDRLGCGGRGELVEHLQGVQRAAGLAFRGPLVGFQAPAVAAVGVAVVIHRGQHRGGADLNGVELEAAAVQDPRVGGLDGVASGRRSPNRVPSALTGH